MCFTAALRGVPRPSAIDLLPSGASERLAPLGEIVFGSPRGNYFDAGVSPRRDCFNDLLNETFKK